MKCIFCKNVIRNSFSVEHILPESLGNIESQLEPGIVCDKCNNYLGRKVESPVLRSGIFKLIRENKSIPNKKGKIPVFYENEQPDLPQYRLMGRFIGKIALEVLTARVKKIDGWNDEIVNKIELDELRGFVRYNKGSDWPFWYRTLYPVNSLFIENQEAFEILHEYDLLYTNNKELYIVLILFGVEFVLNLGGRELGGYRKWLQENNGKSLLYPGKNI